MKTKFQTYYYWFLRVMTFMAFVLLFAYVDRCNSDIYHKETHEDNIATLKEEVKFLKLKNGQIATEKSSLLVTKKQLQKQVYVKDDSLKVLQEKYKDVKATTIVETEYKIKEVEVPFEDPIDHTFSKIFRKENPYYSLSGTVNQNGLTLDNLRIPNTQRIVQGTKDGKPIISITNSNPYIFTNEITNQVLDVPKKKWVISLGGSIVPVKPYVMPSLNFGRKLFEF